MGQPEFDYGLDPETGVFRVRNYNFAPPFSNFLPGIAGKWGVPTWAYYVSRGQAISSFGVRDKDGQILEFQSFNKACMRIAREGFRTLLRFADGTVHEPFVRTTDPDVTQELLMGTAEVTVVERHARLGIEVEASMFTLPNMRVAGLVRRVCLRNAGRSRVTIEWVDGLPRLVPYGLDQARIKGIPRHIEGMMGVVSYRGVPLYRLKQTPDDSERVGEIHGGNFYLSTGATLGDGVVVDPEAVFGDMFGIDHPDLFASLGASGVRRAAQAFENRTPSAMCVRTDRLDPGAAVVTQSLYGYVRRDADLDRLIDESDLGGLFEAKRAENRDVVERIADRAFTLSASPEFDAYARQDFLDNVIRGGMPILLETRSGPSAFYLYSRQNGDLERDYHFFVLEPTYLSQGTGHYRSVLQNRRTDTWFFPEVEDANLRTFLNLIQLDGYNPLEVRGLTYRVVDREGAATCLEGLVPDEAQGPLLTWMEAGFTPGELAMRLETLMDEPEGGWGEVMTGLFRTTEEGEVGGLHEGFWVDHWHYNVDLLDIYRMIYPDRLKWLLLGRRDLTFFDDPDVVVPRAERAVDVGGRIRSYGAVRRDAEKEALLASRAEAPHTVRTRHGHGTVYRTHMTAKLLTLVVNRLATLDPAGTGVEMEAGKPGWNDSMNGLPGLFGSGLSETSELRRLLRWLLVAFEDMGLSDATGIGIFVELADFMEELAPLVQERIDDGSTDAAYRYWDGANALKEAYRERTRLGVSGEEVRVTAGTIRAFLEAGRSMLDRIFDEATARGVVDERGVPHTYFVNEVTRYRPTGDTNHLGYPTVLPLAFRQRPVKVFLEGAVHIMKDRPEEARAIYDAVRRSPLFDEKLGMYKSCEDMSGESPELGRAVGAYPRGWIENESIYLHMEYKYLLEVLRSGLSDEFWSDAKRALIPFMDPRVYGRSTLEGASFIVSSAYADPRLHGRAFQPRLSGITCEFLHMWILSVAGPAPFRMAGGDLAFALEPRLPAWLFTDRPEVRPFFDTERGWVDVRVPAGSFAFKFLGQFLVTYQNPDRKDTYGPNGCRPSVYKISFRDGAVAEVPGQVLRGPHADAIRNGDVRRIDVVLR